MKVNDLPIRHKFILLYALGVLLPIVVLLGYVLTNVTAEIRQRESQNASQSFRRVYSSLETQLVAAVSLANAISSDNQIVSLAEKTYGSPTSYYVNYVVSLRPMISRYINANANHLLGIYIYTDNGSMLNGGHCIQLHSAAGEPWLKDWLPDGARLTGYVYSFPGRRDIYQMSILRPVSGATRYHHLLKLDLNMDSVARAMEQERDYLSVRLLSPDGYAVSYPSSRQDALVEKMDQAWKFDLELAFAAQTPMGGWRLGAFVNKAPMERSIQNAIWVGLLLGAVCSVFAGGLSLLFARSIVLRSQRLLRHMDAMDAESFTPITRELGKDEIGELMEHFNAMGARLKQLVNDIYGLRLKQKSMELENVRAELKYLQAQIDPHFLFNTLNAMLVVCVRNGYSELGEVVRALSKIMRRMVDTAHDTIPLREELEFVRMALTIEQFRFADKLTYSFEIADAAMERSVPVMCVQGLVENACKHGVQGLREAGHIHISADVAGGELVISVSDNGVGIEARLLSELQKRIESAEDLPGSVGLQNILRRLRLYYGQSASLSLCEADERGTVATIRIPGERG